MRTYLVPVLFVLVTSCNQAPTPTSILKKSIAYHDPKGQWVAYRGGFSVSFSKEDTIRNVTDIEFDNTRGYFKFRQKEIEAGVVMDSCFIISGTKTCDQIKRTRDYYTYLWGLPMKLQDEGTKIDEQLSEETFNGFDCYKIKVPYEKDEWYFYFDKSTYALRGYMFYQDIPNKKGEVIYLENEASLGEMRIPKNRKWYTTPGKEFLGTDILSYEQ